MSPRPLMSKHGFDISRRGFCVGCSAAIASSCCPRSASSSSSLAVPESEEALTSAVVP